MIEKYGHKGTEKNGIFFVEKDIDNAVYIDAIKASIKKQNATLGDVKEVLAQKAKALGANAVVCFTYGQKKQKLLNFSWDSEIWHGSGKAVILKEK